MQNLFNKYGLPEFEFVKFCPPSSLNKEEQKLLDIFISYEFCCNIAPSATGQIGWIRSEETRQKIRELRNGVSLSDSHKQSISNGLLLAYKSGRKITKPLFGSDNHFFGKNHNSDTLLKMKGKSKGVGGANNTARLVLNPQTGIFYDCIKEAAESLNASLSSIYKQVSGYRKNNTDLIII